MSDNQGNIVIYQTEDGNTRIEVKMEHETVWLSQAQIATLFAVDRTVVTKHLGNIFKEGELDKDSVCANFAHTAEDGKTYQTQFYNLDAIISVGYRIKSIVATHFRRWATERLKEYIIKGFTMDDERLKQLGGGKYWKELLDRI
ncbi:MAG: RhuM family protein, partial [Petrimonas sp.]|nr:RhuM family protein [Petrimonas sp.]